EGQTEGLEDFSPSGPKVQDVLRSAKQLGGTSSVTPGLGRLDGPRRERIESPTAESACPLDERPDPLFRVGHVAHERSKSDALGVREPSVAGPLGNVEIASVPPRNPVPVNIVVCLKQIPNPDLQFQIAPDGKDIRRDALNYKINGADEYALEEAVRLKEKYGGRVVALSLGPKRVDQVLREALAKGADEAVRIAHEDSGTYDVGTVARLLAATVRTLPHDLVLTGVQSDDQGSSATGGLIAGLVGLPHASVVTRVDV